MAEEIKRKRGRPPKTKQPEIIEDSSVEEIVEDQEVKLTPKKQQLKDYYDTVIETVSNNFNLEPNKSDKSRCVVCLKDKPHSDFFRSYSYGHIGNLTPTGERHVSICKRCAKKLFNFYYARENNLKQTLNHWCQTLDLYFSDEIFDAMINLHNSRKGTEMEHKFDYITDYVTALGRAKMIDMTYWDSPYLQNTVKKDIEVDSNYFIETKPDKEYPEEFDDWDQEDLDNYDYIVTIYKYDPFKDEPIEDRKKLYYNLVGLSDEAIADDFSKANAAIDTCRSMQRLDKLNRLRIQLENRDDVDIKEIKQIAELQKAERDNINKNGKEHGFIQKYSLNKSQGSGTLTGIMKQMDEALFEDALVNRYDIATCDGMQQAADASWKAIFRQLNLSDSEFASIVSNQNETIRKLKKELADLKEKHRLYNVEEKYQELKALRDEAGDAK